MSDKKSEDKKASEAKDDPRRATSNGQHCSSGNLSDNKNEKNVKVSLPLTDVTQSEESVQIRLTHDTLSGEGAPTYDTLSGEGVQIRITHNTPSREDAPKHDTLSGEGVQIPLTQDTLTFQSRQDLRLLEIERRVSEELKRKTEDWDREVEQMRREFLELYPVERRDDPHQDSLVATRRGSTDILDHKNMTTLFLEYPGAGRRCKIRFRECIKQQRGGLAWLQFNVSDFEPSDIEVMTDGERIIVTGRRTETDTSGQTYERHYQRKIERPREVDHTKLKSFLTTDGILIIEAPLPPATLNLRRKTTSNSPSRKSSTGKRGSLTSLKSKSSSTKSPTNGKKGKPRGGESQPAQSTGQSSSVCLARGDKLGAQSTGQSSSVCLARGDKLGVPILKEDNGRRKVILTLDMGLTFSAKEISVQIIKENRIQVKARHEERTSDRLLKNKFSKEFELPERIETYSLRGGLTPDGRLLVGALIKGHATGLNKVTAGELLAEDLSSRAEITPCNILDLSTFPPTTPAIILASASWSNPQAQ